MASWASATPVGAVLLCLLVVIWAILGVPISLRGPLPSPGRPWQRILIALCAVLAASSILVYQTASGSSGSKPAAPERDVGDGGRTDGSGTAGSRDRLDSRPTVTVDCDCI